MAKKLFSSLRLRLPHYIVLAGIASLLGIALAGLKQPACWSVYYPGIGTGSSPRLTDLNGDGILDVVMGAGAEENQRTDVAVMAIDGKDGQLLWKKAGRNQMVGSALFQDITKDHIPDVFIGGRTAELMALDGRNGKLIWEFFPQGDTVNAARQGWYNFYTPQWVPDQDKDGVMDLLIANGGDNQIAPFDTNRPAGRLLVLSGRTGKVLAQATMPDGKETYMSAICANLSVKGNTTIVFGTGGETIGGHLFRTTLQELMQGDLSQATLLASSEQKGFIAPPVFADINRDGVYDILANEVEGRLIAINGADNTLLWEKAIPGTEAYSTPTIGYFNGDSIPDFFINYGIGVWPGIEYSVQCMLDGRTGGEEFRDTIGAFQYASAVVVDYNTDGYDEVLLPVNEQRGDTVSNSYLVMIDFREGKKIPVGDTLPGINLASTPWIGDLDQDQKADIVYSSVNFSLRNNDLTHPIGLRITCLKTQIAMPKILAWGHIWAVNIQAFLIHYPLCHQGAPLIWIVNSFPDLLPLFCSGYHRLVFFINYLELYAIYLYLCLEPVLKLFFKKVHFEPPFTGL
ncbi:PQQ-binding-like beta-propeller repeat protein [Rhodocytophaga rosea]|uniref:PQQ-binding-like beta-propeller repeat protein n=1 Tax=Rhodocytophaga rosea TaxID=2704465 RepID=A0A6C0GBK6_9BACT|nr:PQQ-binding-like beta-propeller repeat protein [Rhodocytophaga rosea]QHT65268.1 PQQ-binding-like beta-propeller repeat protein [Rhodocytophaga rosea]